MPPHPSLHPRSRLTTSLFTSTLLLSFLVVGMPHILPCPRPRVEYSDEDPRGRRRRRKNGEDRGVDEQGLEESLRREQGLDERIRKGQGIEDTICGAKGRLELELARERAREEMQARREVSERRRRGHECPVPKPGGWLGALLGFRAEKGDGE